MLFSISVGSIGKKPQFYVLHKELGFSRYVQCYLKDYADQV